MVSANRVTLSAIGGSAGLGIASTNVILQQNHEKAEACFPPFFFPVTGCIRPAGPEFFQPAVQVL